MKPSTARLRSLLSPALLLAFLLPAQVSARVIEFVIDPARSTVQVEPGSNLFLKFGKPAQALNSVTMPAMAPTIGTGGILPDGSTSNGLFTSLEGTILADLDDPLTSIRIIGRRTSIHLGESGSWLPGPPGAETTPTAGTIAVEFNAASILFVGNAVLRESTFSLDSGSAPTPLTPAATNVYSFPAGCAVQPCPSFRLEDGVGDLDTMFTDPLRDGLRSHYFDTSPAGTTGTLEKLPDGRYQLTIPFDLSTTLASEDIRAAIPTIIGLAYSGIIVAVPEPDSTVLSLAAVAALLGLLAWKNRQKQGLVLWLVAGAIGVGCIGEPSPNVGTTSLQGSTTCSDQVLRTTKNMGLTFLFEETDALCNLFGLFGTIGPEMSGWNLYPYANFSSANALDRYVVAGVGLVALETFSTKFEIEQKVTFRTTYGLLQEPIVNQAEMYVRARPFNLGVDYELFRGATISLDYGLGTDQFTADGIFRYYPLNPLGGTIQMAVTVNGDRITVGQGYQGVGIAFGIRSKACTSNYQCKKSNPALPYCGPVGCHAGGNGEMCEHDVHCNKLQGYRCSSWQTCTRGAVGDNCQPNEGDCDNQNSCDQIQLMCVVKF